MEIEIFKLSAFELSEAYKDKTLSPVEVTQSIINRINTIDKDINAFVFIDEENNLIQNFIFSSTVISFFPFSSNKSQIRNQKFSGDVS